MLPVFYVNYQKGSMYRGSMSIRIIQLELVYRKWGVLMANEEIKKAYRTLGREANFYDGMITCSTVPGKAVCKLVWDMNKAENNRYLHLALRAIPKDFSGKLLEVPVGTGVLTIPIYRRLPSADVTGLDYSADMMTTAQKRANALGLSNAASYRAMWARFPLRMSPLILSCP